MYPRGVWSGIGGVVRVAYGTVVAGRIGRLFLQLAVLSLLLDPVQHEAVGQGGGGTLGETAGPKITTSSTSHPLGLSLRTGTVTALQTSTPFRVSLLVAWVWSR